MADLIRVSPAALTVGKPLPWPVYDSEGNLLVDQGYVITNERQLESLYNRGLFHPTRESRERLKKEEELPAGIRISPFAEYAGLLEDLENYLNAVLAADSGAQKRLIGLARRIDQICRSDPDACIALVHIYAVEPTAYEQTLFYAIICNLVGREIGLETKSIVSLMGAALTANLALLPFQDKLNKSRNVLTDAQRGVIRKHPQLSSMALRKAGIDNKIWIHAVEQHHETFDGSGYPNQLTGDEIVIEARLLALAERYTAMITKRAYRNRRPADEAIREIVQSAQDKTDQRIRRALSKTMSNYPPGVLVRLANNETAVVINRQKADGLPRVKAVVSATGNAFHGAFVRDGNDDGCEIREIVVPDMLPALNLADLWDYR